LLIGTHKTKSKVFCKQIKMAQFKYNVVKIILYLAKNFALKI